MGQFDANSSGHVDAPQYYVGKVQEIHEDEADTLFMKKITKGNPMCFIFASDSPEVHAIEDVVMKLPLPTPVGGSQRCMDRFTFPCDLSMFHPIN